MRQQGPLAGLYIHVPFCGRKCLYCDFYSKVPKSGEMDAFIKAVGIEARLRSKEKYGEFAYDTVFLGGGTPSILSANQLETLFKHLKANFTIANDAEITIEANPTSIQARLLESYMKLGINRISLGVQSFNDTHLEKLGRLHDRAEALAAFREIRLAGFGNLSLDLIYGLPDQTAAQWEEDLEQTVDLNPTHISAYNLIIEPGTWFGKLLSQNKLALPSEETQSEMYYALDERLSDAGYGRYELSNFARRKYECRHNLKYWRLEPHLGLGPSAVSFDGEKRTKIEADLDSYLKALISRKEPPREDEVLGPEKLREEAIMMGLRLTEGLSCADLQERFGYDILHEKRDIIKALVNNGHILFEDGCLKLAPKSLFVSDEVIVKLI
jgi:oxygen-independent coproporphyrinogen-3 oxidase